MSQDGRLLFGLFAASAVVWIAALGFGATPIALADLWAGALGRGDPAVTTIIYEIRLPRALAAFVVGAALGLAGAALQGLLRNPLADPGVLGVSASAALAASAALYFGLAGLGFWVLPTAAALGAGAATALLALAAARVGSVTALILIGAGLSSFAGALMALMMNLAPNPFSLADLVNWMLGTVANRSLLDLALAAPLFAIGAALIFASGAGLSALTLGEEAAAASGLPIAQARALVVIGTGLLVGAAVGLAGAIGFVGLVAPHLVRGFVGHDPRRTLAPAALLGGALLTLADVIARMAPTSSELKLGVVVALIGAPAFVWIAAQGGRRHD